MREQAKLRLEELKKEFETGQSQLQELDRQQTRLREMLLRISGAIQILDETLEFGDGYESWPKYFFFDSSRERARSAACFTSGTESVSARSFNSSCLLE